MRIATWNLESGKSLTPKRSSVLNAAMKDVNADVWALTETWAAFTLIGHSLAAESRPAEDLSPKRRWAAIWTRDDLSATRVEIGVQADRMACCRLERAGQLPLIIVSTVLPWANDSRFRRVVGFRKALDEQEREWSRLKRDFGDCEFILAGDFNQSIPHVRNFGTKDGFNALTKALAMLGVTCLTLGNRQFTSEARIDHICSSNPERAAPASAWSIPNYASGVVTDHEGVAVEIA